MFTSDRDGNTDLYALDLKNDRDLVRLTRDRGMDDAADLSKDGETIVFVSTRDGNADIFVMPFRPENPVSAEEKAQNLTQRSLGDFQPAFSPDGSTIAFSRQLDRSDLQVGDPRMRGDRRTPNRVLSIGLRVTPHCRTRPAAGIGPSLSTMMSFGR